jgi:hypothetical protein
MNTKELRGRAVALRERAAQIDKDFEAAAIRLLDTESAAAYDAMAALVVERAALPVQVAEAQRRYVAQANLELHAQLDLAMLELAPHEQELARLEGELTSARNELGRVAFSAGGDSNHPACRPAALKVKALETEVSEARRNLRTMQERKSQVTSALSDLCYA